MRFSNFGATCTDHAPVRIISMHGEQIYNLRKYIYLKSPRVQDRMNTIKNYDLTFQTICIIYKIIQYQFYLKKIIINFYKNIQNPKISEIIVQR